MRKLAIVAVLLAATGVVLAQGTAVSKIVCDRQYTDTAGKPATATLCRLTFKVPDHTDRVCANRDDGSTIMCMSGAPGTEVTVLIPYPSLDLELRGNVTAQRSAPEPGVVYAVNANPVQNSKSIAVFVPAQPPLEFLRGVVEALAAIGAALGGGS